MNVELVFNLKFYIKMDHLSNEINQEESSLLGCGAV
jgi:hypothetical protein